MKYLYLIITLVLLSGCTNKKNDFTTIEHVNFYESKKDQELKPKGNNFSEIFAHENSWAKTKNRPKIGIALSGGGTKSSPFAMGVLKSFIDNQWINNVDIISSVSGGGYSAYYFYNKAIEEYQKNNLNSKFKLDKYFANCNLSYENEVKEMPGLSKEEKKEEYNKFFKQKDLQCKTFYDKDLKHVKENQDILSFYQQKYLSTGENGINGIKDDIHALSTAFSAFTLNSLFIPHHHLSNSIFDWKYELSLSQHLYLNGIINTYGQNKFGGRKVQTFENLKDVIEKENLPMWIIQTSVFKDSWVLDVLKTNEPNLDNTIFEITPYGYGNGLDIYNLEKSYDKYRVDNPDNLGLDLARSTLASAAFFDALTDNNIQFLAFPLLHLFNLRWGIKIPKYDNNIYRQKLHYLLPFPLYYFDMDSSKITLADGGQSGDNLGLYSLVKRGTENIVIVSGSQDNKNRDILKLEDMCSVATFLNNDEKNYEVYFYGDPRIKDDKEKLDFLKNFCNPKENKGKFYEKISMNEWQKPIWEGKIIDKKNNIEMNVFFIKAAIDKMSLTKEAICLYNRNCKEKKYNYPISLLRFWINNEFGKTTFPQTSTVLNTLNGSYTLFQAYMDLAYHYSNQLAGKIDGLNKK